MTRDCWQDFALSGKVSDYLLYRKQEERSNDRTGRTGEETVSGRIDPVLSGTITEEKEEAWDRHSL